MSDLKNASDEDLLNELRERGLVASVWSVEDSRGSIEEDGDCADLTDEQLDAAAGMLLERASDGLNDVLGQRGNDYLSDRWSELSGEILAEVRATAAPKAS